MIEFNLHGIEITITAEERSVLYKDAKNDNKSRLKRDIHVNAQFLDYIILDTNFQQLSFVKSICQYFQHVYWKRSSRSGPLEFVKEMPTVNSEGEKLIFTIRQKKNLHYLYICHQLNGIMVNELFLDGQEVIQLDIAIGRAITSLSM